MVWSEYYTFNPFVILQVLLVDCTVKPPPTSWAGTSCSRILFELSGAHAAQGRCLTDLRSLFPQAVYHCHGHSPNQTLPPSASPTPSASFPKDYQICHSFQMHSNIAAHVTPHCSLFLSLPIFHLVMLLITCCFSLGSCCSLFSHHQLSGPLPVRHHR